MPTLCALLKQANAFTFVADPVPQFRLHPLTYIALQKLKYKKNPRM